MYLSIGRSFGDYFIRENIICVYVQKIVCKSGLWRGETKYRTSVSVIRFPTVMVSHNDIVDYYLIILYFIALYVFFFKFTCVKMKITKINSF